MLFRLGSKKLFREINFSPFQEGRNFQQLSSFWKITICWKLKGSRAVLFLLFFWSPVPTIAFPFRWCTKPSFNKFTVLYIRALCNCQTIWEIFTFNAPSINIPRIKVTRCESSVGVKNVNSRYERNIGLLKRKKKAKNLDRFNFKLARIFQYDRYGLVCAVNSFHLFLDES